MLDGRTIIVGVTGGIAAYKAAELVRRLREAGASVEVVMTEAACRFVTPLTFQALSGRPVRTSMWVDPDDGMAHIHASRHADLILVAPASADFLARVACGRADDLLTTLCLARTCPLMVAPAMNQAMWQAAPTQRNLATLRADGAIVLAPDAGAQACGEAGPGRLPDPQAIVSAVCAHFVPKTLQSRRVLITAGPTFEPIDPVRGLTNASSGKMGYALARAAHAAGAEVILVTGPTCQPLPAGIESVRVTTAAEMHRAVMGSLPVDLFIAVAAVADYRPTQAAPHKLKKDGAPRTLELVPNPDILAEVAARPDAPYCVGFAAETQDLVEAARAKRLKKNVPLLVANLAQDTLGAEEAELLLVEAEGDTLLARAPKRVQAARLIQHIAQRLKESAR